MGIRHLSYLFLTLLLISCKPNGPTESINSDPVLPNVSSIGDSNKIEIVTWNIERFPKTDHSDNYIKTIIEGLKADIFVLQEIQSKSQFTQMLEDMADFNYLLRTNRTGLGLALVYKKGLVKIKSSANLFESEDHYFAGRPPLLTKLEWQNNGIIKNLTIINVHLKCCGDDSIEFGNEDDEEIALLTEIFLDFIDFPDVKQTLLPFTVCVFSRVKSSFRRSHIP